MLAHCLVSEELRSRISEAIHHRSGQIRSDQAQPVPAKVDSTLFDPEVPHGIIVGLGHNAYLHHLSHRVSERLLETWETKLKSQFMLFRPYA